MSAQLAEMGAFAAATAARYPKVRAVSLSTLPYMDAGASEAQELAAMLCTGVAYLRAMSYAGMSADAACGQIEVTVGVDADVFPSIAKLRAARRVWANLAAAVGASPGSRAPSLYAHTSQRMLTRRDPWVNLLRVTAATFAAGIGGADGLTTHAFDSLLGEPGELGRRMARNTQLLLLEESNLGRVIDPAGGSGYVEALTDELAVAAWSLFQELEAAGGFPTVLVDGSFASRITDVRTRRLQLVATRRQPITGVSEFPSLFEDPVAGSSGAATTVADSTLDRSSDGHGGAVRWAQEFELLRDEADAHRSSGAGFPEGVPREPRTGRHAHGAGQLRQELLRGGRHRGRHVGARRHLRFRRTRGRGGGLPTEWGIHRLSLLVRRRVRRPGGPDGGGVDRRRCPSPLPRRQSR